MTNTLDAPVVPPEPPTPRRNTATPIIAIAVIAVVAAIAVAVVAVVAASNGDDSHTGMLGNGTTDSMMGYNDIMDGLVMNGMGHAASSPTIPGARELAVTATSFKFTPNEIHVRAGEDVTIALTADLAHDFTIDELDFHVAAVPGTIGRGGLHAPSTPGRYTAYCSVAGHRAAGMTATVVVDES